MRNRFDEQLRQLKLDMIRMSSLCETAITVTMQNMLSSDQVYTLDDSEEAFQQLQNIKNTYEKAGFLKEEIDQMERQVENQCMKLLLHQQPVAKDLRCVSSALKMISDMERIGDQADDIAEIILSRGDRLLTADGTLRAMARAAIRMVSESVDAYVRQDVALAERVIASDDEVDEDFERIKRRLIDGISSGTEDGESVLDLVMIAKYYERIADHATNIAEWVEFSVTGVHKTEIT